MTIAGVDGVIRDIEFAFVLPSVGYLMAQVNIRMRPQAKSNELWQRLSLSFVLLLLASLLAVFTFQDRAVFAAIWRTSPVAYSFIYSISGLLVAGGIAFLAYRKLRPELWSRT
jgi:hypothetical protein